jgi:hypothetical protein
MNSLATVTRAGSINRMSTIMDVPANLVGTDVKSLAATAREKFASGQRMRIRASRVVHAVDRERWVAGELVPQPLCHAPAYGWSPDALRPVWSPVTCMRCRRILAAPDELLLPYGDYQPPLFPRALVA